MHPPELQWRRYRAGYCTHPECMVRSGGTLAASAYPALVFRITHPLHGHVLFDTGYSRHFIDATARFPDSMYRMVTPVHQEQVEAIHGQLQAEGIDPDSIVAIFLSHLHGDHVGGLHDFPRARLWCAKSAYDDMRARSRLSALRVGLLPSLLPGDFERRCSWLEQIPQTTLSGALGAFGAAHDLFGDGSLLAVPLPGHAVGHHGLLFHDADGAVFLVGDASWSSRALREGAPPPRFTTGWLGDTTRYRATFDRLRDLLRDAPQVRVVPSHCPEWRPQAQP